MSISKDIVSNSRIFGHVYSEGGTILGSAKVTCNGRKTMTLFDGSYEFKNIETGTYTITASLKGFKSDSKTVFVQKDEVITLNFRLPQAKGTAKILGIVYDAETKRPITSGGTVVLILPISNRYESLDRNGYYEFKDLVEDTYDLWTSITGYEDGKAKVTVAEGEKKVQDFFCKPSLVVEPPWG